MLGAAKIHHILGCERHSKIDIHPLEPKFERLKKAMRNIQHQDLVGWALDALRWATENGIINGKGGGILDPTGQATRAETAQMLSAAPDPSRRGSQHSATA